MDRVLQSAAVHVKVKDRRGSFVSDLAVWGSEVTIAGAEPESEPEGTSLELCRTVEGRRGRDKESRVGGRHRSRKLWGRAMRSMRDGSMTSAKSKRADRKRCMQFDTLFSSASKRVCSTRPTPAS